MANEKSKRILDQSYADSLKEVVAYIVEHDEQSKARELSTVLFKAVSDNMAELKLKPQLLSFYEDAIKKLKFISLPLLEDNEVIELLKNNFCFQLKIEYYDLLPKIEAKLINTIAMDDRSKLKESLRKAILENDEKIVANHEIKLIKDWLKNYVANIGLENQDKLAKTQYLVSLKNDKNISSKEYDNLVVLFDLYDRLSLPSDTPEGFEEEEPIMIKGKLYIFRKGILEEVPENPEIKEAMRLAGEAGTEKTDVLSQPALSPAVPSQLPSSQLSPLKPVAPPVQTPSSDAPPIAELEEFLKNYPPESLEHKAISQEISKLKRSELKKAQKLDAKQ